MKPEQRRFLDALCAEVDGLADKRVAVARQPNDNRIGCVKLSALQSLRFSEHSGGVGVRFPQKALCTHVACTDVIEGEIAHSCQHGPPPHCVKVCILKKANEPKVFRILKMAAEGDYNTDTAKRIAITGRKNGRLQSDTR
jgi:hypothetical protein